MSLEAAALLQSLTRNHAFVDGNNRVAFATTAIFLRMNGYRLKVDPDNGESFIISDVIKKKIEISEIAKWLEKQMKKID
ncbi:MAG: type II toxin-antitoxin system death-on-curing family toxin [Bdellovibrionia bacterium]